MWVSLWKIHHGMVQFFLVSIPAFPFNKVKTMEPHTIKRMNSYFLSIRNKSNFEADYGLTPLFQYGGFCQLCSIWL